MIVRVALFCSHRYISIYIYIITYTYINTYTHWINTHAYSESVLISDQIKITSVEHI